MANTIVKKRGLISGKVSEMVIRAPLIAAKAKPGNFVVIRLNEKGERIPLTIADKNPESGTITIVYLVMGKSTALLETMGEGEEIMDLCGPLGKPTDIRKKGPVVCVGGGTGIAAMHHIAKGHHEAGNHVAAVIGARSKDLLLFYEELSLFCPEVLVATDDGSFGQKGLVTDVLEQYLDNHPHVQEVVGVGPVPMMRAVADATRPRDIPTTVSLNSIMVDGIGMCGACRVSVDNEVRFACVEGPEFDAHKVDFDELSRRLKAFVPQEQESYNLYCKCHEQEKD